MWLLVIGVTIVAAVRVAGLLQVVVLPAFLALILTTLLGPPASWLRRHGWPAAATGRARSHAAAVARLLVWLVPAVGGQPDELGASVNDGLR